MELVTRTRRKWIEKWIALPGIPSHDTFNRVLQLIEPKALEAFLKGVAQWLTQATGVPQGIAVDGKTLRGSQKAGKAIHLLNAWADKTRLVIGQRLVDGKSNEIMEVSQLLESLFLDGCVVTVNALNTQTAIAQKIVDKGADYVLPLKGNHPTHQSVVAAIMRDVTASRPPTLSRSRKTTDAWRRAVAGSTPSSPSSSRKTSGRNSKRLCASTAPGISPTATKPPRAHSSSAASPPTVFREDACRARSRNAAQNLSVLRVCLLNLLRHHKTPADSFRRMIMRAALDPDYLEFLLNLQQN